MQSKICPEHVAIILGEFEKGIPVSQKFHDLLQLFRPLIKSMARNYSPDWREDFIQEGIIGLLNAVENYSHKHRTPEEFIPYAIVSIRNRMVDFFRTSVANKSKEENTCIDEINAPSELYSFVFNSSDHTDPLLLLTNSEMDLMLGIDFKYSLTKENLLCNGFTEKEIEAFNLHIIMGYTGVEIAKEMSLSPGQVSKIINKAKIKAQFIFS
jgi:RNA polymerase sigma factor (sigma-70 family)